MKTRTIVIPLLLVCAVVAFIAYRLWGSMDSLLEAGIEKYGSDIVAAPVSLDKVELDFSTGTAALQGLRVGNPEGFTTDYAIDLALASVALDLDSLTQDTIVVREVRIAAASVIYEMGADGSNIDSIKRNASQYTGAQGTADAGGGSGGMKLVIENFYIEDGEVRVSHRFLKGKTLTLALPDIHIEDIGKQDNGASPAEVAARVMAGLKDGIGTAVATSTLGNSFGSGAEAVNKGAGGLADSAREAGSKLKNIFQ